MSPILSLSASRKDARSRSGGFTLIELLVVIAIILILAGITFGISRGVQNAQARAKAKAELAIIAQALEQFKSKYGDYPWAAGAPGSIDANGDQLFNALGGYMKFDTSGTGGPKFDPKDSDEIPSTGPDGFLDYTKVGVNKDVDQLPSDATQVPSEFRFVDPWGNAYVYAYRQDNGATWENFGYVLYSRGPDGRHVPPGANGVITSTIREDDDNIDNLYAGE